MSAQDGSVMFFMMALCSLAATQCGTLVIWYEYISIRPLTCHSMHNRSVSHVCHHCSCSSLQLFISQCVSDISAQAEDVKRVKYVSMQDHTRAMHASIFYTFWNLPEQVASGRLTRLYKACWQKRRKAYIIVQYGGRVRLELGRRDKAKPQPIIRGRRHPSTDRPLQ